MVRKKMDGWTDGRCDKRMDGRVDERTDGLTYSDMNQAPLNYRPSLSGEGNLTDSGHVSSEDKKRVHSCKTSIQLEL